jgi:hypothetical protein
MSESTLRGRLVLWSAALLLGCAVAHPGRLAAGMTEPEVVAAMGTPTARYPMPDGSMRLEFATGPSGRETWMVDLDAGGRATKWEQVLDGWHFQKVSDGMDRDAVVRILGQPSFVRQTYAQRSTWYWRYPNNDCLIGAATIDPQGRVVGGVGQMTDPACEHRMP